MRFVRYRVKNDPPCYGLQSGDGVTPIQGPPTGEFRRLDADLPLDAVRLLAPILPGKIICVGRNYVAHAKEQNAKITEEPLLFLKPPSSLIGQGETIILPPQSRQVEHEAELAVVIGRRCRRITAKEAAGCILGYTVGNDVTARDLQHRDGQWTRSKSFDTFCPLGPGIETDFDPADAGISCRVNGDPRQKASTRDMVFKVPQLIAFASSIMTLEPGDVIMTGTPSGVGPLLPGDVVEVTIDGLGSLINPVAAEVVH